MFVLRRLTFGWPGAPAAGHLPRGSHAGRGSVHALRAGDWTEQFDFYSDPLCRASSPAHTVRAAGRYVLLGDAPAFADRPGQVRVNSALHPSGVA